MVDMDNQDKYDIDLDKLVNHESDKLQIAREERVQKKKYEAERRDIQKRKKDIINSEKKKIEEAEIRKQVRRELQEDIAKRHADECGIEFNEDGTINENVTVKGKAEHEVEVDPRLNIIPSSLHCRSHSATMRNKYDDEIFQTKQNQKYSDRKISDYIETMFVFFDIEPYYETIKEYTDKNGIKHVDRVMQPNDLPLFSKYGFEMGLTSDDIKELCNQYPRFKNAYELCHQKQEEILATNMLLGLYTSNTSVFAAKNLINWKNDSSVDTKDGAEIGRLLNAVLASANENKFIDSDKDK